MSIYHRFLFSFVAVFLVHSAAVLAQTPEQEKSETPPPKGSVTQSPVKQRPYVPISGTGRIEWFLVNSVGPTSLAAGVFSAGIGTALGRPVEYGPSWSGFAKRYGLRLTGIVTGNAMEAGFGSFWGEDPRYFRVNDQPFGLRIRNATVMTFVARRRDGRLSPAYARYIAIPGNNFLSIAWRPDSQTTTRAALLGTVLGFAGRMGSNVFQEFWPDVKKRIMLGRKHKSSMISPASAP